MQHFCSFVSQVCHCWCPPFSVGHAAFLFISLPGLSLALSALYAAFPFVCLPGLSLLVSALFRWRRNISVRLSPRSVTGGVRPFPLNPNICAPCLTLLVSALFRWPCSISIHLSPRLVTHLSPRSVTATAPRRPFFKALRAHLEGPDTRTHDPILAHILWLEDVGELVEWELEVECQTALSRLRYCEQLKKHLMSLLDRRRTSPSLRRYPFIPSSAGSAHLPQDCGTVAVFPGHLEIHLCPLRTDR